MKPLKRCFDKSSQHYIAYALFPVAESSAIYGWLAAWSPKSIVKASVRVYFPGEVFE